MAHVTGDDVQHVCGSDQLCSGIKGGIEGAIHGMTEIFESHCEDGWGLLLMDAVNGFNSMNRPAALWNARVLWTRCSRFLFNSYQGFALLIVRDASSFILSKEGVTQGDPLGMMFYAIGILPLTQMLKPDSHFIQKLKLQRKLKNETRWTQNWYADDSACISDLEAVLEWLKILIEEGPKFGYFPEPEKSYIVVHPDQVDAANKLFIDYKINVVTGHRFLGGFIGASEDVEKWVHNKVSIWTKSIERLSQAAKSEPHLANVSLTKSLQNEWNYVQRVVSNVEKPFTLLRLALESTYLPALFDSEVDSIESSLTLLSFRNGGLGIRDPVTTCSLAYSASKDGTKILTEAIQRGNSFDVDSHESHMRNSTKSARALKEQMEDDTAQKCISHLPQKRQRTINRIKEGDCSTWLSVLPTHDNQFLMSADEFRDSIALRYGRSPTKMPGFCDGCSQPFDISHALDCKKGGLVIARHNESRDLNIELLKLSGLTQITKEPIVKESNSDGEGALRVDWGVRGFWDFQREALFDIRILNADAPSYLSNSLASIFDSARVEKKTKYSKAAEDRRASFTPFLSTCEAIFDHEAIVYLKKLSNLLSSKWDTSYSQVHGWLKARLQICILRSVSLCIRGSRTKWRGAGIEHGAQIPLFKNLELF